MTTRWPSVATASSDCVLAGSRTPPSPQPQDRTMAATDIVAHATNRVPLWLKFIYTAFMIVLVPVYWYYYGPTNFLYFCDVSLFFTLVGIWIESPLLISMCAVGLLAPQTLWVVDFVLNIFGVSLLGMTDYMFNHQNSLFLRGLSLF